MEKVIALMALSLTLISCATAYRNEGHPTGKEAYVIECEQATSACFKKAKELCPKGYLTTQVSAVGATSLLLFPAQLRTVEIECR